MGELLDFIDLVKDLMSGDFFSDFVRIDFPRLGIGKIEGDSLNTLLPEKALVEA